MSLICHCLIHTIWKIISLKEKKKCFFVCVWSFGEGVVSTSKTTKSWNEETSCFFYISPLSCYHFPLSYIHGEKTSFWKVLTVALHSLSCWSVTCVSLPQSSLFPLLHTLANQIWEGWSSQPGLQPSTCCLSFWPAESSILSWPPHDSVGHLLQ